MQLGDTVRINRAPSKKILSGDKWMVQHNPTSGVVEYISPHGWVLVALQSKGGEALYREGFWQEELEEQ